MLAKFGEQDLSTPHDSRGISEHCRTKEAAVAGTRRLCCAPDSAGRLILLLDHGLSCEQVAKVLFLDDDTVRGWRKLYGERGIAGLEQFDAGGSSSPPSRSKRKR